MVRWGSYKWTPEKWWELWLCWMFCFLYFRAHGSRKFPGPGLPEGQLELSVSFEVVPTSFSACLCFVANVVFCFVSLILSHTQTAVLKNNPFWQDQETVLDARDQTRVWCMQVNCPVCYTVVPAPSSCFLIGYKAVGIGHWPSTSPCFLSIDPHLLSPFW